MSSSVVSSFGGSFFTWFQDEVLPYLLGTLYIVVLILGIVFNAILITTIRKKKMLEIPTNRFVFELTIFDLISIVVFIFPAIIVAFMRDWKLSNYVCQIHGTVFVSCYLVTFGLLIAMSVERAVRSKDFDLHDRVFLKSKAVSWISAVVCIISMGIAIIPQTGWVSIKYDFYQAACTPRFGDNVYYLSIVFTFGICFCVVSYLVTYILIFTARKKALEKPEGSGSGSNNLMALLSKNKEKDDKPASNGMMSLMSKNKTQDTTSNIASKNPATSNVGQSTTSAPKIGWGANNNSTGAGTGKSKFAALKAREKIKKAVTKVKVSKLFSDDDSDPDFHLAVTYFIVACLMVFLWLPYFILSFVSVSDKGLWGGYFSVVSVIAMLSYCLKPVIYLAHNRNFRQITQEAMPEKVMEKANKVRNSISEAINKLDKVMFKSTPAQKQFNATIKTTIVAKGWLGRARNKLKAKGLGAGGAGGGVGGGNTAIQMLSLNKIKEEPGNKTNDNKTAVNKDEKQSENNKGSSKPVPTNSNNTLSKRNAKVLQSSTQITIKDETVDSKATTKGRLNKNSNVTGNDVKIDNESNNMKSPKGVTNSKSDISNTTQSTADSLTTNNNSEDIQNTSPKQSNISPDSTNRNNSTAGSNVTSNVNSVPVAAPVPVKSLKVKEATEDIKTKKKDNNEEALNSGRPADDSKKTGGVKNESKHTFIPKRDSIVEFHYAKLDTGDDTPVIVNSSDGFSDFDIPQKSQKRKHSNVIGSGFEEPSYGNTDTRRNSQKPANINVLPSVPEGPGNANQGHGQVSDKYEPDNNFMNQVRSNRSQDKQQVRESLSKHEDKPNNSNQNTSSRKNPFSNQMSVDSYGDDDNVFYPSNKAPMNKNGNDLQNRSSFPGNNSNRRNTVSVPPVGVPNDIGNTFEDTDPPFTDRNGHDPRKMRNTNSLNNLGNSDNSTNDKPNMAGSQETYNGRRRNTYQPSFLDNNKSPDGSKYNSVSKRMSQVVDIPSQINNNSNQMPLDFI